MHSDAELVGARILERRVDAQCTPEALKLHWQEAENNPPINRAEVRLEQFSM